MALNRKFIAAQFTDSGIDDSGITAILNEHHSAIQGLKDEIDQAKTELAKAKTDLENAIKPNEGLQADFDAEKAAHKATKEALEKELADEKTAHKATQDGIVAEKDAAAVDGLVGKLLETADADGLAMSKAAIPIALKQYDRALVKRDKDGNITNADEVVKHFKDGDFKEFFGKTETSGINAGNSQQSNQNLDKSTQYKTRLEAARKEGNTAESVRIKTEAAKDGVYLI